jgi:hypothetical protein
MRFIKNLSASWIQVPLLKHSFVSLVCLAKNGLYGLSRFETHPQEPSRPKAASKFAASELQ